MAGAKQGRALGKESVQGAAKRGAVWRADRAVLGPHGDVSTAPSVGCGLGAGASVPSLHNSPAPCCVEACAQAGPPYGLERGAEGPLGSPYPRLRWSRQASWKGWPLRRDRDGRLQAVTLSRLQSCIPWKA